MPSPTEPRVWLAGAAAAVLGIVVCVAYAAPPRPPYAGGAPAPAPAATPASEPDHPIFAAEFGEPDGALLNDTLRKTTAGGALWIDGEVVTGTAEDAGDVDAATLQLGRPSVTGALVLYRLDGTPAWAFGPDADPYQAADVIQNFALQLQPSPIGMADADASAPSAAEVETDRLLAAIQAGHAGQTVREALSFIGGERPASENRLADAVADALLASPEAVRRVADHLDHPLLRVRVAAATLLPRALPRDRWPTVPDGFLPAADRPAAAAAWRAALTDDATRSTPP